ncbi:MAG: LuxR C-terminal-related transcriptional regulator [Spirochaetaceae bacterium]|jgi:LuxR family maltose regulon positive regulatory protein|nr:LuxR C-terminal-related transcriptional regulator [Spirochaetaceae bacterium]
MRFFHSNVPIVPGNQTYLERPHLNTLLEKALQSPVVMVVAGAGYGKTYSVYSFLHAYNTITAWIQLSERDNLVFRFWENFVQAVASISEESAEKLRSSGFPETKRQFDRYMTVPYMDVIQDARYVFVYDDFHLLHNEKVLSFLRQSITAPFRNITSILISRNEPDINTMPLLSKGLLAKITENDLRFSQKEMTDYFQMLDLHLSQEALNAVYRDTEGWAFAIHLTGLSLKNGAANTDYARSSMKINIFNLITHEVFGVISKNLQRYLIKLSLIEHWNLELLAELALDPALMEEIKRIGSFVHFDLYLNEYRLHPLFLQYLGSKQNMLSPGEKKEVYSRAADWCLRHNFKMDAVSYYEKAGDYASIITLVYTMAQVIPNDMAQFFLEIFQRAPEEVYEKNPESHVLRVRFLLIQGRFEETIENLKATISRFEALENSPFTRRVLFGSYIHLGFYYLIRCIETQDYTFYQQFALAHRYYPEKGLAFQTPANSMCIGSYICRVGCPEKGHMERFIQAMDLAVPHAAATLNGCMSGYEDLARAEIAYFQEEMERAEAFGFSALHKARENKQFEIETRALFYLLRINIAYGKASAVDHILKQITAQLSITEYINRHTLYDISIGWFYAQIEQTRQLPEWLKNDFEVSEINSLINGLEVLVKIKYQLSKKRYDAVLATLENQSKKYGVHTFLLGRITILAIKAVCYYRLKDRAKAIGTLESAYALSEPNNLTMLYIELGKDMRALLGEALKGKEPCAIPFEWLEKMRRKSAAYAKKICAVMEKYQDKTRGEALSNREISVLTGLSQGLTREEIADISALSVNTVKSVITSIYIKLGAVNRADAIRLATEFGILKI